MSNRLTKRTITLFESIKHVDESGNEYWTSRAMWRILGDTEYRHFLPVIEKAKVACQNSDQRIEDHFEDVLGMVFNGINTPTLINVGHLGLEPRTSRL